MAFFGILQVSNISNFFVIRRLEDRCNLCYLVEVICCFRHIGKRKVWATAYRNVSLIKLNNEVRCFWCVNALRYRKVGYDNGSDNGRSWCY